MFLFFFQDSINCAVVFNQPKLIFRLNDQTTHTNQLIDQPGNQPTGQPIHRPHEPTRPHMTRPNPTRRFEARPNDTAKNTTRRDSTHGKTNILWRYNRFRRARVSGDGPASRSQRRSSCFSTRTCPPSSRKHAQNEHTHIAGEKKTIKDNKISVRRLFSCSYHVRTQG